MFICTVVIISVVRTRVIKTQLGVECDRANKIATSCTKRLIFIVFLPFVTQKCISRLKLIRKKIGRLSYQVRKRASS